MSVSTKGRYALHIAIEIARESQERPVSLRCIADSLGISLKYLEQIVMPMMRAKLLSSTRGAHGGYKLARPATRITAGDVLRATEKGLFSSEKENTKFWKGLDTAINTYLDSITLAQLAEEKEML